MRVLALDQFSDPGGAQQCLVDLLPALRDCGHDVLVGLPGNGKLFEDVRALGIEAAQIRCGEAWEIPILAAQIRELGQRIHADLLYVNGPRLLPGTVLAGTGIPVVFHSHNRLQRGRAVAGISLSILDATVIASCRYVAEQWEGYSRRSSVIYNGVAGIGAPRLKREGPPRIGCIGRISPEKGQIEFIEAARLIHRRRADCRFLICGASLFSTSDYQQRVHAAAEGLPVEFRGWTRDVYEVFSEVDLLLVPSVGHEATTRVILEAYSACVPVIAFPTGGIPEVVEHGGTGFLAGSVEDMANRALTLLSDSPIEIVEAARAKWVTAFTLERYRAQTMKALTQAV